MERYRDGRDLLYDLVGLAGRRHFALQRWLWAIQNPEEYDLDMVRKQYFDLLPVWNEGTWGYRAKLRLLLGDRVAARFLDYADDSRDRAESLHYMFVGAHYAVRQCEHHLDNVEEAQAQVDRLNNAWSTFADEVAEELLERATGLQLLELPKE